MNFIQSFLKSIKVRQGESAMWLFSKVSLLKTTRMKRSRRELSIDMDIHKGISKNNQITLFPLFHLHNQNTAYSFEARSCLRIFQRFRLVKFIKKFKTCVKNLKIEKIIAFNKYLLELFFVFYFHPSKNLFLILKNNEVADLTHFSTKCGCL